MKRIIASIAIALTLAACGGGEDPAPIAQCNGTPKAAVVYVGTADYPELRGLPDACVYSTQATTVTDLGAVVDTARAAAGVPRAYMIGTGTALPLAFRVARPGISEITSLWFVPAGTDASGIVGNLATVYLNSGPGGSCVALAAQLEQQRAAAVCTAWPDGDFGPDQRAAAIAQLHLELIR